MPQSSDREEIFTTMLLRAIERIAFLQNNNREVVRRQLARSIGRKESTIEYWIYRKHLPKRIDDLENLVRQIARLDGWQDAEECLQFLINANHPAQNSILQQLYPHFQPRSQPSSNDFEAGFNSLAPFVVGVPIQQPIQFYGRDRELRRIFGALQGRYLQNIAITGPQRSGKTSLLHYIRKITRANPGQLRPNQFHSWLSRPQTYHWIYVDFQDARTHTQENLFRYILSRLDSNLVRSNYHLADFIDLVSENIMDPTIILFDEIQVALEIDAFDQEFWWGLRSLATNQTEGKLGYIIASQKQPNELFYQSERPSPFFNIFGQHITLGPITESDSRALIANSPVPFSPEAVEWILQTSHNWPALLQILCQAHLTALQDEAPQGQDWRAEGLSLIAPFRHLLEIA